MSRPLSETDRKILECLQRDPRSAASAISEETGIPQSTVRNRLNRMLGEGVVEIAAVVNPLLMGDSNWAMVALKVPLRKVEEVSRRLVDEPAVYFVGSTTGAYNLLVGIVLRSNAGFSDFVEQTLAKIEDIQGLYSFNVLKVYKRSFLYRNL